MSQEDRSYYLFNFGSETMNEAAIANRNDGFIPQITFYRSVVRDLREHKNLYVMNMKYSDLNGELVQIYKNNGVTNDFFITLPCRLYEKLYPDDSIDHIQGLVVSKGKETEYTNTYNMVMNGKRFKTKALIIKWGKYLYELPCD
jgi:hypothetical protein